MSYIAMQLVQKSSPCKAFFVCHSCVKCPGNTPRIFEKELPLPRNSALPTLSQWAFTTLYIPSTDALALKLDQMHLGQREL